jgi:hypothetical protein
MRPRERRETGEQDLFRSRLDQIIDLNHALAKLARAIDWLFLEREFGAVYTDKAADSDDRDHLFRSIATTHYDRSRPAWTGMRAPSGSSADFSVLGWRQA